MLKYVSIWINVYSNKHGKKKFIKKINSCINLYFINSKIFLNVLVYSNRYTVWSNENCFSIIFIGNINKYIKKTEKQT